MEMRPEHETEAAEANSPKMSASVELGMRCKDCV